MRIRHGPGMDSGGLPDESPPADPEGVVRTRLMSRLRKRVLSDAYEDGWATSKRGGKRLKGRRTTESAILAAWWRGFHDERSEREEGEAT